MVGRGGLSKNFWIIFPSFVHLLANKHMAKQSRASGQLSGGHWVEYRVEFWLFFSSIFQNFSNFLTVLSFLIFLKFSGMRFSFPSIWEYSKHFQSNFYVPAVLASIKLGLAYINQPLCYYILCGPSVLDQPKTNWKPAGACFWQNKLNMG